MEHQLCSGCRHDLIRRPIRPHLTPGRPDGVIACAAYSNGVRTADVAIEDISEAITQENQFVWIGLYEPSLELLREVQREFGLHDLAIEDALTAHQRPKLEQY